MCVCVSPDPSNDITLASNQPAEHLHRRNCPAHPLLWLLMLIFTRAVSVKSINLRSLRWESKTGFLLQFLSEE
jgi:hypothetical protein